MADDKKVDPKADDAEVGETASTLEEADDKGFLGTEQDPEPNESYAVGGKLSQQADKEATPDSPETPAAPPDPPPSSTSKSSGSGGKSSK